MNNVLRGIVIAPSDVDLLTEYPVVVSVSFSARFHRTQIRACAGLSQIHGP